MMPLPRAFNAKAARAKRPCPIWVDRFQTDTQHLAPDEVGAYFLLLMAMWSRETCDFPDDDCRLARVCRVSPRLWRSRIGAAIRPFLQTDGKVVFQKRLRQEATFVERAVTAQSERKAVEKSGKPLKDKDVDQSADYSVDSTTDDLRSCPTQLPNHPTQKEEEGARAREADFFEKLRTAVGLDPTAAPPPFWLEARIEPWVTRWRKVGLTDDQILAEAKASRAKNPEPPEGPKALNAWMMQAATNRAAAASALPEMAKAKAAKVPMSPEKRLEFWAGQINGPGYVPPTAVSSSMRNALIASGLVTEAKMRERGL